MQDQINKPVFVVGSPRSGTSILAWCLGQHPNMFPVPESNWMGQFAVSVAISYEIGSARGDRSLLSGMDIRREEFFANFGRSINELILAHRRDLERKRKMTRPSAEPKTRWVNQTPEYSLHICGLRRLFPDALFVHICRDVRAVVRSMLNFHRVWGVQLVANEEKAYEYWLRTVSACINAEEAYGPNVVYRLRYADLVSNPESAMHSLLNFLHFVADDPATDPALVAHATRLSAELETNPQSSEPSPAAADALEIEFQQRTQYVAALDKTYKETERLIRVLEKQNRGCD